MNTFRIGTIGFAVLAAACSATNNRPVALVAPAAPAIASIAGDWILAVNTPIGLVESKMGVIQNGNRINGRLEGMAGNADFAGTVDANDVAFSYTVKIQGSDVRLDYTGTLVSGGIKGKAKFGTMGEGNFTARRP